MQWRLEVNAPRASNARVRLTVRTPSVVALAPIATTTFRAISALRIVSLATVQSEDPPRLILSGRGSQLFGQRMYDLFRGTNRGSLLRQPTMSRLSTMLGQRYLRGPWGLLRRRLT